MSIVLANFMIRVYVVDRRYFDGKEELSPHLGDRKLSETDSLKTERK